MQSISHTSVHIIFKLFFQTKVISGDRCLNRHWGGSGCFHTGNATAVIVYREKCVSKHISPQRYILSFY